MPVCVKTIKTVLLYSLYTAPTSLGLDSHSSLSVIDTYSNGIRPYAPYCLKFLHNEDSTSSARMRHKMIIIIKQSRQWSIAHGNHKVKYFLKKKRKKFTDIIHLLNCINFMNRIYILFGRIAIKRFEAVHRTSHHAAGILLH